MTALSGSARHLDGGDLCATWVGSGPPPPLGISRLSGHLSATWHGGTTDEDLATTAARIERIQVVSREWEEVAVVPAGRSAAHGGRSFAAVPESVGLRDVDTAPGGLVDSSPPGRRDTSYRDESGWLVDLRIEG
ncbi:hypothetical protein [Modestobacter sp. Leaf380]|uniref:hypothetical protein n=1 Tax=Modestobacter sp. Leaf380 TaxID=1736356 RepID=UPI000700F73F|nr:hypothetical protein [Modestobacter sp. Leaf380]KQS69195.1 hypothetical protein ASG41_22245 [Modestobacter sp. Leaf380]